MKWVKHFTDNNRSQEMHLIKRELGMAGIGCFWTLVEACAGLMEKSRNEKYSEAHCHFKFDVGYLANMFGCKQHRVQKILETFQECNQLRFSKEGFVVTIEMPKLLEWLDRDTDRARPKRGQVELREDIEINKDKDIDQTMAKPKFDMPFYFQVADEFRLAARKFSAGDKNIIAYLGEQKWGWWLKIGGVRIREMPLNEKGRQSLAYAIRDVVEKS